MIGNDLPQQGGITGRMPYNPMMNNGAEGMQNPGINATPPPQFSMPGIQAPDMARQDPWDVSFGPTSMPPTGNIEDTSSGMPVPGQGMPEPPMDAGARMREIYQPTNDASQRFEQAINQYPEQKRPGWLQGIGSLLQEYAYGPQVAQQTRDRWRSQPIEDWKNKIAPMQQAATNERYENANERQIAYQQMSIELREKAQLAKEKNDQRRADILQQRADVYSFRANNPDLKIIIPKGGNVQAFNPRTGETHDTGIPSGSMTELDKIQMQGDQRIEQITASGAQARETEGVRQAGRIDAITARGEEARKTKEVPTGGASGKGMLPTQVKVDQYNRARQLANSNPELAKFIKPGSGANEFQIVKPDPNAWTESGKGPTPQQYSDIINAIYGPSLGGRSAGAGPGPAAKPPTSKPPAAPPGWKYVAKPGGGWTAVPDTGIQ
jgi:hypothetical protein